MDIDFSSLSGKALIAVCINAALLVLGLIGFPRKALPLLALVLGVAGVWLVDGLSGHGVLVGIATGLVAVGGHSAFKNTFFSKSGASSSDDFVNKLGVVVCALLLSGCSTFSTEQRDISYGENGKPEREIITVNKARAFWDSKSALGSFTALQTDKTQSTRVGGLTQETSATNVVELARVAAEAAATGVAKALIP